MQKAAKAVSLRNAFDLLLKDVEGKAGATTEQDEGTTPTPHQPGIGCAAADSRTKIDPRIELGLARTAVAGQRFECGVAMSAHK